MYTRTLYSISSTPLLHYSSTLPLLHSSPRLTLHSCLSGRSMANAMSAVCADINVISRKYTYITSYHLSYLLKDALH